MCVCARVCVCARARACVCGFGHCDALATCIAVRVDVNHSQRGDASTSTGTFPHSGLCVCVLCEVC